MKLVRAIAVFASIGPLFAQYGGPAILARGQSPGAASGAHIDFRPYVAVTGTYDSGLNGVAVDTSGTPINDASYGVSIGFGVSGTHAWKRTQVGLNYSGGFSHYAKSFYDGVSSQTFQLSLIHRLSRHAQLSIGTSAALYGENQSTPTLPQTIAFDPSSSHIPTNDFFNNRTVSASTMASVAVQLSARTSVSFGGDGFLTRRRSSALFGSTGYGAHGDIQRRMSRRTTIGAMYNYMHYMFTGVAGGTDAHTVAGTYSMQISRSTQFSSFLGISRYENLFVQIVSIDPAIAAVIGISSAQRVSYVSQTTPNFGARLSKTVPRGTVFVNASHSLNPGNGLFLTSTSTDFGVGYSYTGLRRWSISSGASYDRSDSEGNIIGQYGSYAATVSVSRQVAPMTHAVFSFNARRYSSPDFKNYNKWAYALNLGLSFAPGDVPIRFW